MTPLQALQRLEHRLLERRAARTPSLLQRLATLLSNDPAPPDGALALCIELGLVRRARQLLDRSPALLALPAAIQLAWLEGDFGALDRCAADPAAAPALARAPQAVQNRCLSILASRSPQAALAVVQAMPRRPACAPAVALRAGEPDTAAAWLRAWPWQMHADYLLLAANQAGDARQRLALLNRYLARHGLAPLQWRQADAPLGVTQLSPIARAGTASTAAAASAGDALLSVVIPAYDNAVHVRAAIESMLWQTRRPDEILVIDDASRDGTAAIVEALAREHAAIRVIRLPHNRGAYFARNLGLAAARGRFVAFHDADDFAHPQRLDHALAPLLADEQLHATTGRCVRLADDGQFGEARVWPLTRWTPISLLVRREVVLRRVGYFDDLRFGADSEYVARLRLLLGERHHRLVAKPLSLFGQRAGSLTTSGDAGFDRQGWSGPRIAYQQAWTERHLAHLLQGDDLFRPLPAEVAATLADLDG
ncbi:glycosyltransferase family A protein [Methylibium sp. Root1272]|jgi:hypothetical protein|uniref:glycosyltransferase family 2 protein n=1 Tax=Methylibium sp. Root1272 TaxID=1736441 RepID=UPI0007019BCE|nr:glycosyltransferase family A protein [Methylibium sp. Root1272]KQW65759.1 hypothetical protein ASC67_15550 [Methylibium sp. Root1272]